MSDTKPKRRLHRYRNEYGQIGVRFSYVDVEQGKVIAALMAMVDKDGNPCHINIENDEHWFEDTPLSADEAEAHLLALLHAEVVARFGEEG